MACMERIKRSKVIREEMYHHGRREVQYRDEMKSRLKATGPSVNELEREATSLARSKRICFRQMVDLN